MTNEEPKFTPNDLSMVADEAELGPELEPGTALSDTVGQGNIIAPDTEPPATTGEGGNLSAATGSEMELVAPEFSPVEVGITELEREVFVEPEEPPQPADR